MRDTGTRTLAILLIVFGGSLIGGALFISLGKREVDVNIVIAMLMMGGVVLALGALVQISLVQAMQAVYQLRCQTASEAYQQRCKVATAVLTAAVSKLKDERVPDVIGQLCSLNLVAEAKDLADMLARRD